MSVIDRSFICFDPKNSHNKYWNVKWDQASSMMTTTWGAVGSKESSNQKFMTRSAVEKVISEKIAKGYKEIERQRISVLPSGGGAIVPTGDARVTHAMKFIDWVRAAAGQKITSYLDVPLSSISERALGNAENILSQASDIVTKNGGNTNRQVYDLAVEYFHQVPTKIPRQKGKIDPAEVLKVFTASQFNEQSDRLLQLRSALQSEIAASSNGALLKPATPLNHYGETEFELLESGSEFSTLLDYLKQRARVTNIKSIFKVKIPAERAAFEAEAAKTGNVAVKFHGSYAHNFAHIFKTGLILPKSYTHGWRFGAGIYSADNERAKNYCHPHDDGKNILLVLDVALGKEKSMGSTNSSLRAAPAGYDSVRGVQSYSGMDEWIVYRPSQATIKYAVVWG